MSMIRVFFGGRPSNIFDPFTLQLWNSSRDFALRSSLTSTCFIARCQESSAFANIQIGWKETSEAHLLKVDLPGLKKEEVKVEVVDGIMLQISGEMNVEEDKTDTWHRMEHSSSKFLRRFRLPKNTKINEINAAMENGVLTVMIPKEDLTNPDIKTVEISG